MAKFCGKCGTPIQPISQERSTNSKTKASIDKEAISNGVNTAKDSAQKTASKLKQVASESQITDKVQASLASLNRQPAKKAKILKIAGGIAIIVVLFFGWNWFSNRDYRQAMANGDSYFSQGEYPQAIEFYQQAHDEKPGDERAMEMRGYSQELSDYWVMINQDNFWGSRNQAVEEIEGRAEQISDSKIKDKYLEAAETIKNSNQYQLEERIGDKYKDAYGID